MSLDVEVRGDPGACRETARRLARLGASVEAAADCLVRQAHVCEADFGGLSGDAFRAHAGALTGVTDDTARRCHRLGRALAGPAADLEDVERRAQHDWRTALRQCADAAPSAPAPWDGNPTHDSWPLGDETAPDDPPTGPPAGPPDAVGHDPVPAVGCDPVPAVGVDEVTDVSR